jgi:hypothetical protein
VKVVHIRRYCVDNAILVVLRSPEKELQVLLFFSRRDGFLNLVIPIMRSRSSSPLRILVRRIPLDEARRGYPRYSSRRRQPEGEAPNNSAACSNSVYDAARNSQNSCHESNNNDRAPAGGSGDGDILDLADSSDDEAGLDYVNSDPFIAMGTASYDLRIVRVLDESEHGLDHGYHGHMKVKDFLSGSEPRQYSFRTDSREYSTLNEINSIFAGK